MMLNRQAGAKQTAAHANKPRQILPAIVGFIHK
jgi:hypothetical protein